MEKVIDDAMKNKGDCIKFENNNKSIPNPDCRPIPPKSNSIRLSITKRK